MIGRLSPAGRCVRIQKRHCWKFLRSFYRQRCLHARLRTYYPLRLRYFQHRKREQRGFTADETLSQSRDWSFPANFFRETKTATIMSVESEAIQLLAEIGNNNVMHLEA